MRGPMWPLTFGSLLRKAIDSPLVANVSSLGVRADGVGFVSDALAAWRILTRAALTRPAGRQKATARGDCTGRLGGIPAR